jgi:hypothetical protein
VAVEWVGLVLKLAGLAEQATRSEATNMSILFDSPIPYESISEGRRKEQALGGQLAKSMMDSYFRATSQRAQQEQWAEEAPLREANQTMMAARAENEKLDAQAKAMALMTEVKKKENMVGLAAVEREAALSGWNLMSRIRFKDYIAEHPEFRGSPEEIRIESTFDKADKAKADLLEWQTKEANDLLIAREREKAINLRVQSKGAGLKVGETIIDDNGDKWMWDGDSLRAIGNDDKPLTGKQILDEEGKPIKGIVNINGKPQRLPNVDPLGDVFTTPPSTNSVGAAGASSATKVYDYDANGRRIQK